MHEVSGMPCLDSQIPAITHGQSGGHLGNLRSSSIIILLDKNESYKIEPDLKHHLGNQIYRYRPRRQRPWYIQNYKPRWLPVTGSIRSE